MTDENEERIVGALISIAQAAQGVLRLIEEANRDGQSAMQEMLTIQKSAYEQGTARMRQEEEHRMGCALCRSHYYPVAGYKQ